MYVPGNIIGSLWLSHFQRTNRTIVLATKISESPWMCVVRFSSLVSILKTHHATYSQINNRHTHIYKSPNGLSYVHVWFSSIFTRILNTHTTFAPILSRCRIADTIHMRHAVASHSEHTIMNLTYASKLVDILNIYKYTVERRLWYCVLLFFFCYLQCGAYNKQTKHTHTHSQTHRHKRHLRQSYVPPT